MTLPLDRRRALQQLGLRALLKRRFGAEVAGAVTALPFGGGAALVAGTRLAAVFADGPAGLGAAVDLAARAEVEHLYFFSEHNDGAVARRAAEFRLPTTVVDPDGDFEDLAPAPAPVAVPMPDALAPSAGRLAAAGLDVEWESGVLSGEWLGLEVARAVLDQGRVVFDVGVGRHDRDANRLMHPEGPSDSALDQATAAVRERRRPDGPPHPARDLVPERWLRVAIRRRPELAGLAGLAGLDAVDGLRSGPAPAVRDDLRRRMVAPLAGRAANSDTDVVVACTVGVDPDAVAQAADARCQAVSWPGPSAVRPDAALRLVVPEGDDHPLTRRLAALLRHPAEVVIVPADWRQLTSSPGQ